MDLITRINDLVSSPSCVYEALEPILQSCEAPDDIAQRTWLTVKLSICEFLAAHIDFPEICRTQANLAQCTRLLETKATWWTTYSGNYRQISVICNEYQPQHEARRALGVLTNATDLFDQYEQSQRQALVFAETAMSLIVDKWHALDRNISAGVAYMETQLETMRQTAQYGSSEVLSRLSNLDIVLASTANELKNAADLGKSASDQSLQLMARFQDFEGAMVRIHAQHSDSAESLRSSVHQASSVLEATNEALKGYSKILMLVTDVLKLFVGMLSRFWLLLAIGFVVLALRYFSRRKKSAKQVDLVTPEYSDPIFL